MLSTLLPQLPQGLGQTTLETVMTLNTYDFVVRTALAAGLGIVLALVYRATHKGLSYSQSFTQTIVFVAVIVALVMMTVRNSLATAFTLVGALSTASPGLMPAPSGGVMIPSVLVEQNPQSGARNVMVLQSLVGGTGARDGGDGVDGRDSSLANQRNTPIEKTEEEAAAYDVWFRAQVEEGLRSKGPWVSNEEVMREAREIIENAKNAQASLGS